MGLTQTSDTIIVVLQNIVYCTKNIIAININCRVLFNCLHTNAIFHIKPQKSISKTQRQQLIVTLAIMLNISNDLSYPHIIIIHLLHSSFFNLNWHIINTNKKLRLRVKKLKVEKRLISV